MTDYAKELRRVRADMIGTDDEAHYWLCHDTARHIDALIGEINRLRTGLYVAEGLIDGLLNPAVDGRDSGPNPAKTDDSDHFSGHSQNHSDCSDSDDSRQTDGTGQEK